MKNKELILNPYFISGLFMLMLNDFCLKQEFGNFLTGKLSDFAGLLIFPMFMAALSPKLKKTAAFITGIGFILWKLPLMTPIIDWINHVTGFGISRVIDYTDYMALAILPLSHYLINRKESQSIVSFSRLKAVSNPTFTLKNNFHKNCTSISHYVNHNILRINYRI
ncbi:hypothetical protein, partial [Bacteroides sp. 519]|uniref:hypothetical protein n=1 Tax=Bacteroides sp. 519 TaxID=2302937 RepID=UPI0019403859